MKGLLYCLLATSYLFSFVLGDLYLHQPRGSNNRLTESSATRANGNRLFDSQVGPAVVKSSNCLKLLSFVTCCMKMMPYVILFVVTCSDNLTTLMKIRL